MTRQLVYVASRWGEPTQTFVRREAEAVRDEGVEVTAVSIKPPGSEPGAIAAGHLRPGRILVGCLRALVRRPVVVAGIVGTVVRRSRAGNVPAQLAAAAVGVAWAGSGRLPPGHLHAQFGWVAATTAWAAARAGGRPFSVMLHAFEIHDPRYVDGFTGVPLRAAVAVFVESAKDQRIVEVRHDIAPVVVRLGLSSAWLEAPAGDRDPDLVVSVGRLVEKKGYPVLLDALAACRHPWRCEIVGDGPLEPALAARIDELGLADRVTLRGALPGDEVRQVLSRAAVMCLASVSTATGDRDGTPMALIEAMACGAAVVSTDTGAIAELVADAGIVVAPNDAVALAAALDEVADPGRRDALAGRGRARVLGEWTAVGSARTVLATIGI